MSIDIADILGQKYWYQQSRYWPPVLLSTFHLFRHFM